MCFIKSKLENDQDIKNLDFTHLKGNNCIKLKITHKSDKNKTKFAEIEINFSSEELLKLKDDNGNDVNYIGSRKKFIPSW